MKNVLHSFSRAIGAAVVLLAASLSGPGLSAPTLAATVEASSPYWLGEYFNNATLAGRPVLLRTTRAVWFNWGRSSPGRAIVRDNFSARWSRPMNFPRGTYRFFVRADDGVRIYIDNQLVIDDWRDGPARDNVIDRQLEGEHLVRVEYYERADVASIKLTITAVSGVAGYSDWRGEYFNNTLLTGQPVLVRNDRDVNFDFGSGSPDPIVATDGFSARWSRTLYLTPAYYTIAARVDDGVRVYANNRLILDGWQDGGQRDLATPSMFFSGNTDFRVEYYDRGGGALIRFSIALTTAPLAAPTATAIPFYNDWRGEYFNNATLSGAPVMSRNDREINFNFGGGSPDPRVQVDNFTARWTRTINFNPGNYRFKVYVDDGARVYVGNTLVIDAFVEGGPRTITGDSYVSGATEIRVEYFEFRGNGQIQLSYESLATQAGEWRAEFFNNMSLSGVPVYARLDSAINFDWGNGTPAPNVQADGFSARWTRRQFFNGTPYRVEATFDDGMRVYIDNVLVLDQWSDGIPRTAGASFTASSGDHDVRVEYYERGGGAVAKVNIAQTTSAIATAAP